MKSGTVPTQISAHNFTQEPLPKFKEMGGLKEDKPERQTAKELWETKILSAVQLLELTKPCRWTAYKGFSAHAQVIKFTLFCTFSNFKESSY